MGPSQKTLPPAPVRDFWADNLEHLSPRERIEYVLSLRRPNDQRFLSLFMEQQCSLRDMRSPASNTHVVTYAFKVDNFYCNHSGNLHGGAQSAIFDFTTSLAMQAYGKRDYWINAGVTRSLSVSYLRPAPEGMDLLLEAEVTQMGKQMALIRAVLKREKDGVIISTCEHHKAAVAAKPEYGNVKTHKL